MCCSHSSLASSLSKELSLVLRLGSSRILMAQTNRGRFQMLPLEFSTRPLGAGTWNRFLQEQKLHVLPEGESVCHQMCSHLAVLPGSKCLESTLSSGGCLTFPVRTISCLREPRVLQDPRPHTRSPDVCRPLRVASGGMGMWSLYLTGNAGYLLFLVVQH